MCLFSVSVNVYFKNTLLSRLKCFVILIVCIPHIQANEYVYVHMKNRIYTYSGMLQGLPENKTFLLQTPFIIPVANGLSTSVFTIFFSFAKNIWGHTMLSALKIRTTLQITQCKNIFIYFLGLFYFCCMEVQATRKFNKKISVNQNGLFTKDQNVFSHKVLP